MKTIVVGYDGDEASRRALDRAGELARALEAQVVVVSISPVLVGGPRGAGPIDPVDSPELHRDELQEAKAALDAAGVQAELVLGHGEPAEAIVELAEERGADMIVVGSRELNLAQRLLGQSVSGPVARHARCDVLIVH